MAISETKMQIVIDNYFQLECDINTSIKEAFEKGFRIGVQKGKPIDGFWVLHKDGSATCNHCHTRQEAIWDYDNYQRYCGYCGAHMTSCINDEM